MIMYLLLPVSILTTVISYPYHYHHYNHDYNQHNYNMNLPPGPWYPVHHPLHNHPPGHPWHRPTNFFPHGHPQNNWNTFHKEESPVIDISGESSEEDSDENPFNHSLESSFEVTEKQPEFIPNKVTRKPEFIPIEVTEKQPEFIPVEVTEKQPEFTPVEVTRKEPEIISPMETKNEIETSTKSTDNIIKDYQTTTLKPIIEISSSINDEIFQTVTEAERKENDLSTESNQLFLSPERNDDSPYFVSKVVDQNELNKFLNLNKGKTDENTKMFTSQPDQSSYVLFDQTNSKDMIYNLPDITIKNDVIEIKSPNSPKIHITSPAIVINDDDKIQENILSPQTREIPRDESAPIFGGTNLDEPKNEDFHENVYKDLLNTASDKNPVIATNSRLQSGEKKPDLVSEINKGTFSNVFAGLTPEQIKNMEGYNEKELEEIQKVISQSIQAGLIDNFKQQIGTSSTSSTTSRSLISQINEGKFDNVWGGLTEEEIKKMEGYNARSRAEIEKEINKNIESGLIDYLKKFVTSSTTTESGPLPSELRSVKLQ